MWPCTLPHAYLLTLSALLHNVYNQIEAERGTFPLTMDRRQGSQGTQCTFTTNQIKQIEGKETRAQDDFQETLSSIELLRFKSTLKVKACAIEERGHRTLVSGNKKKVWPPLVTPQSEQMHFWTAQSWKRMTTRTTKVTAETNGLDQETQTKRESIRRKKGSQKICPRYYPNIIVIPWCDDRTYRNCALDGNANDDDDHERSQWQTAACANTQSA